MDAHLRVNSQHMGWGIGDEALCVGSCGGGGVHTHKERISAPPHLFLEYSLAIPIKQLWITKGINLFEFLSQWE